MVLSKVVLADSRLCAGECLVVPGDNSTRTHTIRGIDQRHGAGVGKDSALSTRHQISA